MPENYCCERSFYLHNPAGAEDFKFSKNFQVQAKWERKEPTEFLVELENVGSDFHYELKTKVSSTIIQKIAVNKYAVKMEAWNPLILKATFPVKEVDILKPILKTNYKLQLDKEALGKLNVNEFFENQVTVFDEIILEYSIRRDTNTAYVVTIKCKGYNLNDNSRVRNDFDYSRSFWCNSIEFQRNPAKFLKKEINDKESVVTFWLNIEGNIEHKTLFIKDYGNELDYDKIKEFAFQKYGPPDFFIDTSDGIVEINKKVLTQNSKVFENIFEDQTVKEITVTFSTKVIYHFLAYTFDGSASSEGDDEIEMELIKFAEEYQMEKLKVRQIEILSF
uniref:BTB domain-containing protein n=1 Tax=Panagrolaimus sp. ES5 TaxID=591445 RepID=A0AC34FV01_9BILA